jgi:GAF domain-containing protein
MTECISGWAMLAKQSVCVANIEMDDRIPIDAYRPTFVRSLMMVPIGHRRPVGALGAYWSMTGVPDPERLAALERVADAAADAIKRVGLEDAPWAPNFRVPGASQRPAVLAD